MSYNLVPISYFFTDFTQQMHMTMATTTMVITMTPRMAGRIISSMLLAASPWFPVHVTCTGNVSGEAVVEGAGLVLGAAVCGVSTT